MFRKTSFILLICFAVLTSCVTDAVEHKEAEPIQALPAGASESGSSKQMIVDSVKNEDGGAEAAEEALLLWCEPDDNFFNDNSIPLPSVIYHPVVNKEVSAAEVEITEPPVSDAPEPPVNDSSTVSTTAAAKEKAPSFLEAILNPKAKAVETFSAELHETDRSVDSAEQNQVQAEKQPEVIQASEPENSVEIEPEILILTRYTEVHETYLEEVEGEGWILESYGSVNDENAEMLKYKGREYLNGNTYFSFYPIKTGSYTILLRRTDFAAAKIERKRINLDVFSSIEEASEEDESVNIEKPIVETSERLPEQEEPPAPLPLDTTGLKEAAAGLEAAGDCRGAADLIRKNIAGVDWAEKDYFYFVLGRLYESCSRIRDERLAADYYQKVIDLYPVSIYWIESRERIAYLERNFIYIR